MDDLFKKFIKERNKTEPTPMPQTKEKIDLVKGVLVARSKIPEQPKVKMISRREELMTIQKTVKKGKTKKYGKIKD